MLSAYMENTRNGEKSIKIKHMSVNNRTTLKNFISSFSIREARRDS